MVSHQVILRMGALLCLGYFVAVAPEVYRHGSLLFSLAENNQAFETVAYGLLSEILKDALVVSAAAGTGLLARSLRSRKKKQ